MNSTEISYSKYITDKSRAPSRQKNQSLNKLVSKFGRLLGVGKCSALRVELSCRTNIKIGSALDVRAVYAHTLHSEGRGDIPAYFAY